MCDDESTKMVGGCSCCCALITGIILIIMSIATLPINTWGLDYSGIGKTVDPTPQTAGIKFLGPLHSFIQYPTTQQTFSFQRGGIGPAISARTIDGLIVTFNANFQFRLNKGDLFKMYMKFGEDYQSPCSRYAIDVLNDSAAKNKASAFFKQLNLIRDTMLEDLKPVMLNKCYLSVTTLQLSDATLPSKYNAALQATNAASQEAISVIQEQNNIQILQETKIAQTKKTAPILVVNAEAKMQAKTDNVEAQMKAYKDVTVKEAQAYAGMKTTLGFKTDESLLNFIKVKTIGEFNQNNLMIGVQDL